MTENSFKLSFNQLLVFTLLQIVLLVGAFYLGTRYSSSKGPTRDEALNKLFPGAPESVNSEATGKTEDEKSRVSSTPFDKSSATVFRIKSSANSGFTVQVASFSDESSATQVVETWRKKGYLAFLSVEDIPDRGKWFRVNVGNYGDEESAQSFAKKIEEKEHITPQVVTNE